MQSEDSLSYLAFFIFSGDTAFCGTKLPEVNDQNSDKEQNGSDDIKKICVSPSVKYAGCDVYAKKRRYKSQRLCGVTVCHLRGSLDLAAI